MTVDPELLIHSDAGDLAFSVASRFVTALVDAQSTGAVAQVVLTGDPERNETQARDAFLSALDVDPARVHPMPADTGQGAEAAAAAYAEELAAAGSPTFDVLMLGVGPDGHVASLFPGYPQLGVTDAAAVAVHDSPKPPPTRVSLTLPQLNRAREVWFVVSGSDKAEAVAKALTEGDVPAARPKGRNRTLWLLDEAAAEKIPNA